MRVRHLTDDEVVNLLLDPTPDRVTRERIRRLKHFSDCSHCHGRYNEFAQLVSMMGEADVWDESTLDTTSSRAWAHRVAATLQKIAEERAGVDTLLEAAGAGSSDTWKANLPATDRLRTYGMVDALLAHADRLIHKTPTAALDLTSSAVEIADELPVDAYPFDLVISLRSRASREHAYSLYYTGRLSEALQFVERAEHLVRQTTLPAFSLARIALMRALIYRSTGRLDEAIRLTNVAAATFGLYGDDVRYVNAKMTEGAMLFEKREYTTASAIWQSLESNPLMKGLPSYAFLLQHMGSCYRQMNDLERARDYYSRAIAVHDEHGAETEKSRVQWSLALIDVAAGRQREALPLLRQVWRKFAQLQMQGDAALVGLKVAEVLLMLDEPEEVPAICRALLDQFTRNGMNSPAVAALSYLREAVAMGKATPALVSNIHDFLRDLPTHPTRAFHPPQI